MYAEPLVLALVYRGNGVPPAGALPSGPRGPRPGVAGMRGKTAPTSSPGGIMQQSIFLAVTSLRDVAVTA
jgi:hypothetical protein